MWKFVTAVSVPTLDLRAPIVTQCARVLMIATPRVSIINHQHRMRLHTHCAPPGLLYKNVEVPASLLHLAASPVNLQDISIGSLQLLWPTLTSPLTIRAAGVRVFVQQKLIPQVRQLVAVVAWLRCLALEATPLCAATNDRNGCLSPPQPKPQGAWSGVASSKLRVLETLLWQGQNVGHPGWHAGWRNRVVMLLRWLLALALRNLAVDVSDVQLQYSQAGEPGPANANLQPVSRDAVAVAVRSLKVMPVVRMHTRQGDVAPQPETSGGWVVGVGGQTVRAQGHRALALSPCLCSACVCA